MLFIRLWQTFTCLSLTNCLMAGLHLKLTVSKLEVRQTFKTQALPSDSFVAMHVQVTKTITLFINEELKVIFSTLFHIWISLNKSKISPIKIQKEQNFVKNYAIRAGKMAPREEVLVWTFNDLDSTRWQENINSQELSSDLTHMYTHAYTHVYTHTPK